MHINADPIEYIDLLKLCLHCEIWTVYAIVVRALVLQLQPCRINSRLGKPDLKQHYYQLQIRNTLLVQ